MPARNQSREQNPALAIKPAVYTDDLNGEDVDLQGFGAATLVLESGTKHADTTAVPKLQHADDDGAGAPDVYADVTAADLVGSFANMASDEVQKVGYRGSKRWVRAVLTLTGATKSIAAAASIVRGFATHAPSA